MKDSHREDGAVSFVPPRADLVEAPPWAVPHPTDATPRRERRSVRGGWSAGLGIGGVLWLFVYASAAATGFWFILFGLAYAALGVVSVPILIMRRPVNWLLLFVFFIPVVGQILAILFGISALIRDGRRLGSIAALYAGPLFIAGLVPPTATPFLGPSIRAVLAGALFWLVFTYLRGRGMNKREILLYTTALPLLVIFIAARAAGGEMDDFGAGDAGTADGPVVPTDGFEAAPYVEAVGAGAAAQPIADMSGITGPDQPVAPPILVPVWELPLAPDRYAPPAVPAHEFPSPPPSPPPPPAWAPPPPPAWAPPDLAPVAGMPPVETAASEATSIVNITMRENAVTGDVHGTIQTPGEVNPVRLTLGEDPVTGDVHGKIQTPGEVNPGRITMHQDPVTGEIHGKLYEPGEVLPTKITVTGHR